MPFARETARETIDRVKAAVAEAFKDEGITVAKTSATFGDLSLKITLNLEMAGEGGETQEARDFTRFAGQLGMDPEWLGKAFRIRQTTYTVVGLSPGRPAYPVSAVTQNGRRMKFGADVVISYMNHSGAMALLSGAKK